MAAKRKTAHQTAEQAADSTPAAAALTSPTEAAPPTENPATLASQPPSAEGKQPSLREPGDDAASEPSAEPRKASWAPRTTIAVPLTEEAKRDHTRGEVARYIDGYDTGVGARIDSPDKEFRPSEEVKEPLKEEHPYRESMRWNKKDFHKKVIGQRPDGSERRPVAERLDAEERFEDMVQRRRAEIDKADSGKTPF
jgi:hypothetical protein